VKAILKSGLVGVSAVVLFLGVLDSDAPLGVSLGAEAHAIIGLPFTPLSFAGVARRTAYRTVAYTSAAAAGSAAAAQTAAAQQQAAAAQQQAAAAQQEAAAQQQAAAARAAAPPPPPAPAPTAGGRPLPIGTVVSSLPAGCVSTPVGGVDYFYCGGNFYRAAFQGNNLVYVTAQP
jgi:hypothetical protein